MASELCMNCFSVKGQYEVCPFCGYAEGTPPEQPHYLVPGTILGGHFIVGTAIGVGGFGITYKCYDTTLGVIVAVKEFYPAGLVNRAPGEKRVGLLSGEKAKQYKLQTRRFLMEAQSIAQFGKAKDIVNVYDYFEENNTAYIIMEYVDGVLLKDYLDRQGKMNPGTAMSILEPIVEAVKKIHAQGIIHRDISPDNIFIASDDAVKVFDFGAARLNNTSEAADGQKVIKVGYSAPEQYRDTAKQGYFTDIYSIGAIFYQMLTGQKPLESTEREYKDELKSPRELGVPLENNLDKAVMEALAVQPELRFQGITQFDDAIHGRRAAEYPREKLKKRRRRRNWTIAGSILAVVAVVMCVALFNTVYKPENVMFDTNVTQDTVVIWVDSQDQKTMFEDLTGKLTREQPEDSDAVVQMKKENQNITYQIRDITKKSGENKKYQDMDSALAAAEKGKEKFPDVFLTDNVSDLGKYHLASYQDTVYQNISPQDYLYLSQYPEYFSDMTEMPTSFDVLLFYGVDAGADSVTAAMKKAMKKRRIASSTLLKEGEDGTIPLETILAANEKGGEYTWFDEKTMTEAAILQCPESFKPKEGKFTFGGEFPDVLERLRKITKRSKEKRSWKTQTKGQIMYGNSVLAGSGYRSEWYQAKIENLAVPYRVLVPTVDGKMLVSFRGKLAVSADSSRNKQIAGMRFVYFALGQQQAASNKDTAYPISHVAFQGQGDEENSAFQEFFHINQEQEAVERLIDEQSFPCMLIGKGTGTIAAFSEGIRKEKIAGVSSLEEYCRKFKKARK